MILNQSKPIKILFFDSCEIDFLKYMFNGHGLNLIRECPLMGNQWEFDEGEFNI